MMVDDHSKGLADVKTRASAKGLDLPDSPDAKHKAVMIEFKALSGGLFDSRYVKQAGVGDHEATEKLLKKTQADAKDADLKALAGKMVPVAQGHLQDAKELVSKTASKSLPGLDGRRMAAACAVSEVSDAAAGLPAHF